jgi:hypothetical protein
MVPESFIYYGLHDVRGYEAVIEQREYEFWSHADSSFQYNPSYLWLYRPDPRWLAAAGVAYVMSAGNQFLPSTRPVFRAEGVTIAKVMGTRPFAYAATTTVAVTDRFAALKQLSRDPLGPVVVEGRCCTVSRSPPARVKVDSRRAGAVDLDVTGRSPSTVVVLQSFSPGWVARVDGHEVPVQAADVLFQAVRVSAGHHVVSLRYEPRTVTVGGLLSAAGLLGIILLVMGPLLGEAISRRRDSLPSSKLEGDPSRDIHP